MIRLTPGCDARQQPSSKNQPVTRGEEVVTPPGPFNNREQSRHGWRDGWPHVVLSWDIVECRADGFPPGPHPFRGLRKVLL